MKTKFLATLITTLVLLSTLNLHFSTSFAQGTAFTYQGRLTDNGTPANGAYDFQFTLYDMFTGGSMVGSPVLVDDLSMTNGLFTMILDFGPGSFPGARRFLEIGVRPGASSGAYTNVTPRQQVLASPYAMMAGNISGTIATAQLDDGAVTGPKLADGAVIAAKLAASSVGTSAITNGAVTSLKIAAAAVASSQLAPNSVSGPKIVDGSITDVDLDANSFASTFWKANGNLGTTPGTHFLGTTDNQPLELKVNNARALRLELNGGTPTLVGGYSGNLASGSVGGTIAGGGSAALVNRLGGNWATVGGGLGNEAMGFYATVAGGRENLATNIYASANGGYGNLANGQGATVGGGETIQPPALIPQLAADPATASAQPTR